MCPVVLYYTYVLSMLGRILISGLVITDLFTHSLQVQFYILHYTIFTPKVFLHEITITFILCPLYAYVIRTCASVINLNTSNRDLCWLHTLLWDYVTYINTHNKYEVVHTIHYIYYMYSRYPYHPFLHLLTIILSQLVYGHLLMLCTRE